jgi:hypothetical protein
VPAPRKRSPGPARWRRQVSPGTRPGRNDMDSARDGCGSADGATCRARPKVADGLVSAPDGPCLLVMRSQNVVRTAGPQPVPVAGSGRESARPRDPSVAVVPLFVPADGERSEH